jgi:hypothetical protein
MKAAMERALDSITLWVFSFVFEAGVFVFKLRRHGKSDRPC